MARRKETENVIDMIKDRVEAELAYASRLERISSNEGGFRLGQISDPSANF